MLPASRLSEEKQPIEVPTLPFLFSKRADRLQAPVPTLGTLSFAFNTPFCRSDRYHPWEVTLPSNANKAFSR